MYSHIALPLAALALLSGCGAGKGNETAAMAVPSAAARTAAAEPAHLAHPVAVELFTSQGCSSCPPADRIMERLAANPDIVAITRPVTYWDRLGWKDTLALPANTALQAAYARRGFSGAGTFTPQSVVQGRVGIVGGRESAIRAAIAEAGDAPAPDVTIARANGSASVALAGEAGSGAQVSVVALRRDVDVAIGFGENAGRTVRYANVLVKETPVGDWKGGKATLGVPAAALHVAGADRYALLVRQGAGGRILAARYI